MNQKEWIRALDKDGWTQERGGKLRFILGCTRRAGFNFEDAVKMTKTGQRPITLPMHRGSDGKNIDAAFGALRFMLAHARLAGKNFEDAWWLAATVLLSRRDGRRHRELWAMLYATRDGWRDAYAGRASRLAELTGLDAAIRKQAGGSNG